MTAERIHCPTCRFRFPAERAGVGRAVVGIPPILPHEWTWPQAWRPVDGIMRRHRLRRRFETFSADAPRVWHGPGEKVTHAECPNCREHVEIPD